MCASRLTDGVTSAEEFHQRVRDFVREIKANQKKDNEIEYLKNRCAKLESVINLLLEKVNIEGLKRIEDLDPNNEEKWEEDDHDDWL